LFRVKGKKQENIAAKTIFKQAVYFQHGFLDSSDSWVCNHEKYNLPIIFVERGFDVVQIFTFSFNIKTKLFIFFKKEIKNYFPLFFN